MHRHVAALAQEYSRHMIYHTFKPLTVGLRAVTRIRITAGGRLFVNGQNRIKIRDADFGRGKIRHFAL